MGVSDDCKIITDGASCQAACTVGFESANHTELSCLAVGQLESNSVPPYLVCECVDVATSDSSMLAPYCPDLTYGDQRKVMRAAGYTGGASALTCTNDVVNGSVSLIGILPNCSAASCAVDGIPSGMSHECDGIAFLESCYANCSDGSRPRQRHIFHPVLWVQWLSRQRHSPIFAPLAEPCLSRAVRSSTTPWRAWIAPL